MDETQKQLLTDIIMSLIDDDLTTAQEKFKTYSELKSQEVAQGEPPVVPPTDAPTDVPSSDPAATDVPGVTEDDLHGLSLDEDDLANLTLDEDEPENTDDQTKVGPEDFNLDTVKLD